MFWNAWMLTFCSLTWVRKSGNRKTTDLGQATTMFTATCQHKYSIPVAAMASKSVNYSVNAPINIFPLGPEGDGGGDTFGIRLLKNPNRWKLDRKLDRGREIRYFF